MSGIWIDVAGDDSVESIAFRHGLLPETIWQHQENAALRRQRVSMHVLLRHDRLFVPALAVKSVACATQQRHRFVRRAVPARLPLKLLLGSIPVASLPCRFEIPGCATILSATDADGYVQFPVMPDVAAARLVVELGDGREVAIALAPRALDPVDTATGVQARLRNLGYLAEAVDGVYDLPTVLALAQFQSDQVLTVSGAANAPTRDALLRIHGS
jgi:N-acetylmuramoyl-L-alanine amidase